MTPPIADAALLASQAGPGGVLDPKVGGDWAYLDLRADRPAVARSRLALVARAFGPRLALQEGLRLLIASGELAPKLAAAEFARALPAVVGDGGPLLAAIRGEDVLDQLELLADAVGEVPEGDVWKWLHAERRPILSAHTPAPRGVVQSALESGATVVVSRLAPPEALAAAPSDAPTGTLRPVTLQLVERYELIAPLREGRTIGEAPPGVGEGIGLHGGRSGEADSVVAHAKRYDELLGVARRVELAMGAGVFDTPLEGLIRPRTATVTINVPGDRLEFGCDLRTVGEWREG